MGALRNKAIFIFGLVLLMALGITVPASGAWIPQKWEQMTKGVSAKFTDLHLHATHFKADQAVPGAVLGTQEVTVWSPTNEETGRGETQPVKYRVRAGLKHGSRLLFEHTRVRVERQNPKTGAWEQLYDGLMKDMSVPGGILSAAKKNGSGNINDSRHAWRFTYSLDLETPNEAQGKQMKFELIFDSTQLQNPAW